MRAGGNTPPVRAGHRSVPVQKKTVAVVGPRAAAGSRGLIGRNEQLVMPVPLGKNPNRRHGHHNTVQATNPWMAMVWLGSGVGLDQRCREIRLLGMFTSPQTGASDGRFEVTGYIIR